MQEWFVREHAEPPVVAVRFGGAERARPAPGVLEALRRRRDRDLPVEPRDLDRADPRGSRHPRRAGGPARPGRRPSPRSSAARPWRARPTGSWRRSVSTCRASASPAPTPSLRSLVIDAVDAARAGRGRGRRGARGRHRHDDAQPRDRGRAGAARLETARRGGRARSPSSRSRASARSVPATSCAVLIADARDAPGHADRRRRLPRRHPEVVSKAEGASCRSTPTTSTRPRARRVGIGPHRAPARRAVSAIFRLSRVTATCWPSFQRPVTKPATSNLAEQIAGHEPIRLTTDDADDSQRRSPPTAPAWPFAANVQAAVSTWCHRWARCGPAGPPRTRPAFSPDGPLIRLLGGSGSANLLPGSAHVFVIESGGGQARQIGADLAAALHPVWSPSGEELLVLGRKDGGAADWWTVPVQSGPAQRPVHSHVNTQRLIYTAG